MPRPLPSQVQHVAVVGAGVIGGGWAAHFLRHGLHVTAWDPAPEAESKLRAFIAQVWPTMERLGLAPG
ncbi:MAG: 3-hydroxyacyl-CoA dehydrogenase NAD-binding domain-containing protein, partial [Anaerolineales bacterium]